MVHPSALEGKTVHNGSGARLGVVVGVETWPGGGARQITVREDSGHLRVVNLDHVRAILETHLQLKGPREGFHIAPVGGVRHAAPMPGAPTPGPTGPPGGTGL